MTTNYVLIDYENVPVKSIALLKGEHFRVSVFVGPKNTKLNTELVIALQEFGGRASYIKLDAGGHNALDFHIAYYLGKMATAEPTAFFHVISKDKGFDPLLDYLRSQNIECARSVSIEAMPCFASSVATPKTVEKPVTKAVVKARAGPATKMKADELVEKMVVNLKKLGTGIPKSEKTLKGKIKNWCGAAYSEKEVEAIFKRLVKKGLVTVDGMKVSYQLPDDPSGASHHLPYT